MIEEAFKDDKNTTLIDKRFDNLLQMKNLNGAGGSR
jgi:hypothetical protein